QQRALPVIDSLDSLPKALGEQCPDLMYWLCHADPSALVLGEEDVTPDDLVEICAEQFTGLVVLNARRAAEHAREGSVFDALYDLRSRGLVATEEQTVNIFANQLGLDFLERFLDGGERLGPLLRDLRRRVPLGLLYGAYCPPDLCVTTTGSDAEA